MFVALDTWQGTNDKHLRLRFPSLKVAACPNPSFSNQLLRQRLRVKLIPLIHRTRVSAELPCLCGGGA